MKDPPDPGYKRKLFWIGIGCTLALLVAWLVPDMALMLTR